MARSQARYFLRIAIGQVLIHPQGFIRDFFITRDVSLKNGLILFEEAAGKSELLGSVSSAISVML